MSVLDELREALVQLDIENRLDELFDVLDKFEAAHPGLKDDTCTCRCCGKPYAPYLGPGWQEMLNPYMFCPECGNRDTTAKPCPVCAKEASDA